MPDDIVVRHLISQFGFRKSSSKRMRMPPSARRSIAVLVSVMISEMRAAIKVRKEVADKHDTPSHTRESSYRQIEYHKHCIAALKTFYSRATQSLKIESIINAWPHTVDLIESGVDLSVEN